MMAPVLSLHQQDQRLPSKHLPGTHKVVALRSLAAGRSLCFQDSGGDPSPGRRYGMAVLAGYAPAWGSAPPAAMPQVQSSSGPLCHPWVLYNQLVWDLAPPASLLGWAGLRQGNGDFPVSRNLFWTHPALQRPRAGLSVLSQVHPTAKGLFPGAALSVFAMEELHQLLRNHPCCESQPGPGCFLQGHNQAASQDGTRWTSPACGSCSGRDVFPWLTLGVISLQLLLTGLVNSLSLKAAVPKGHQETQTAGG